MVHSDFVKLLGQLASLTPPQRAQVRSALDERSNATAVAIASVIPSPNVCPRCQAHSEQLRPWGYSHGLARSGAALNSGQKAVEFRTRI